MVRTSFSSKLDFSAGEIAPCYHHRADTALARAGLKTLRNWRFSKAHGLQNRPGTEWIGEILDADLASETPRTTRLIPFHLDARNDYLLEFGDRFARVVFNRRYVTNLQSGLQTIETESDEYGVLMWKIRCSTDVGARGLKGEDIVSIDVSYGPDTSQGLDGRFVKVQAVDGFYLTFYPGDGYPITDAVATTAITGDLNRLYQFATPYASGDLHKVQYVQPDDPGGRMYLVHPSYPMQRLVRYADDSWDMAPQGLAPSAQTPAALAFIGAPPTGAAKRYVVTSVNDDGVESLPQTGESVVGTSNPPTDSSPLGLAWAEVVDAKYYNVYASVRGREFGLIGRTEDVGEFYDSGVEPDTSLTPPRGSDPFKDLSQQLTSGASFSPPPLNATCVATSPDKLTVAFGAPVEPYLYVYHRVDLDAPWNKVDVSYYLEVLYSAKTEGNNGDENGQYNIMVKCPLNGAVTDVSFSPNGHWLAIAGSFTGIKTGYNIGDQNWTSIPENIGGNYCRTFPIGWNNQGNFTVGNWPIHPGDDPGSGYSGVAESKFDVWPGWTDYPNWTKSAERNGWFENNVVENRSTYSGQQLHANYNFTLTEPSKSVCFSSNGTQVIYMSASGKISVFEWSSRSFPTRNHFWLKYFAWIKKTDMTPGGNGINVRYDSKHSRLVATAVSGGGWGLYAYNYASNTFNLISGAPDTQPSVAPRALAVRPQGDVYTTISQNSPYVENWLVDGDSITKISPPGVLPGAAANGCRWSPDGKYLAVFHDADGDNIGITMYAYDSNAGAFTLWAQDDTTILKGGFLDGEWFSDGSGMVLVSSSGGSTGGFAYVSVKTYPAVVACAQGRLLPAHTIKHRGHMWGSVTYDPANFSDRIVSQVTDSFYVKLAGDNTEIKHLVALGNFIECLCAGAEYVMAWPDNGSITAKDIPAVRVQSRYGIGDIAPVVYGSSILFVSGQDIREIKYSQELQAFDGRALNAYAYHLFKGKVVVDLALQRFPEPVLWVTLDDGGLLMFKYDPDEQIMFWEHDDTDGEYQSTGIARNGDADDLYRVVDRNVGGVWRRFLEVESARQYDDFETGAAFVDSSVVYDGSNSGSKPIILTLSGGESWAAGAPLQLYGAGLFSSDDVGSVISFRTTDKYINITISSVVTESNLAFGTSTDAVPTELQGATTSNWTRKRKIVSGLAHLEGKQVAVLADGFVVAAPGNPDFAVVTVTRGQVTLPKPYQHIRVGLSYRSDFETLPITDVQNPKVATMMKNISSLPAQVIESRGFWVGHKAPADDTSAALKAANFQKSSPAQFDTPGSNLKATACIQPFTGIVECKLATTFDKDGGVFICHTDPTPLSIGSIYPSGLIN